MQQFLKTHTVNRNPRKTHPGFIHAVVIGAMLSTGFVAPARAAVLGYWDFEEYSAGDTLSHQDRLLDTSGNGRDAYASNGGGTSTPSVVTGSGTYGQTALRFSSSNDDEAVFEDGFNSFTDGPPAAGSDINFVQDDSFTLEVVFKLDGTDNQRHALVAKDVGGDSPSWWLRVLADGTLQAIVDDTGVEDDFGLVTGSTTVDDNEWHHMAFVRDADNDKVRLYVDSILDDTGTDSRTARVRTRTTSVSGRSTTAHINSTVTSIWCASAAALSSPGNSSPSRLPLPCLPSVAWPCCAAGSGNRSSQPICP